MPKTRVLVVDDEASIRKFVRSSLQQEGYDTVEASDGEQALQVVEQTLPSLVILDINMPKLNGMEVCRRIREWSSVPIIMLSAREDDRDKVQALRLGADDYLSKPFSIEELIARVEAVLRRTKATGTQPIEPNYSDDYLQVNFAERRVTLLGNEVDLTPTEYALLRELVLNRGKVMTHRMLLHRVWGEEYGDESGYVRVFITRLRHKLDSGSPVPKYIKSISGVGYRYEVT